MEGTNRDVTAWRKSTYSADNNGDCVEVGGGGPVVVVRDTKDRAGALLAFGADAWARFAATVRDAGNA
jgi:Domain of unknown function (DUF397)